MTIPEAINYLIDTDPACYEHLITKVVDLTGLDRLEVARWLRDARIGKIPFKWPIGDYQE